MLQIIKAYFRSWIDKDPAVMESSFAEEILYVECYGPVYRGREQCLRWFEEWNKIGSVLEWDIRKSWEKGNTCIVEWFFKCEYEDEVSGFDGVSLVEYKDGKIVSVKEFQSQSEHSYPYENR